MEFLIVAVALIVIIAVASTTIQRRNLTATKNNAPKPIQSPPTTAPARGTPSSAPIARSRQSSNTDQYNIFISYRRSDSQLITKRIYDALTKKFGKDSVFLDVDSIPHGERFPRFLEEKVSTCRVFIPVIGPVWVRITDKTGKPRLADTDDYVRSEIETAILRHVPIIPIFVDETPVPRREELPIAINTLSEFNGCRIKDQSFDMDIKVLIKAIENAFDKPPLI
jgi:hypothetical protein